MRSDWQLSKLSLEFLTSVTLGSWLIVGVVLMFASFGRVLTLIPMSLIHLPLGMVGMITFYGLKNAWLLKRSEKLLLSFISLIWIIHATGLLVPETGFDAVWYHLPVAQKMVADQGFVHLPNLYQTLNPLFSDLLFIASYGLYGELGAKIVAYAFGLTLMLVAYQLARLRLSVWWSLWVVLLVSTFQVVSWQVTSFYVDLAKATWEIAALWLLLKPLNESNRWPVVVSGLLFGASLGTKAFSWLLVPVYCLILFTCEKKARIVSTLIFLSAALAVAGLFYLRPWFATGNPFLSISLHVGKLNEIGGEASVSKYLTDRLITLPRSLFDLTFVIRDYVSLVFLVLLPLFLWQAKSLLKDMLVRHLLVFGIAQYCIWWFVPPLSTRYALSGFIVLLIIWIIATVKVIEKHSQYYWPVMGVVILACLINFAPRALVAHRNLRYVIDNQSKIEYLQQFYDGSIDEKLKLWHGL